MLAAILAAAVCAQNASAALDNATVITSTARTPTAPAASTAFAERTPTDPASGAKDPAPNVTSTARTPSVLSGDPDSSRNTTEAGIKTTASEATTLGDPTDSALSDPTASPDVVVKGRISDMNVSRGDDGTVDIIIKGDLKSVEFDNAASVDVYGELESVNITGDVAEVEAVGDLESIKAVGDLESAEAVGNLDSVVAAGNLESIKAVGDLEEAAATGNLNTAQAVGNLESAEAVGDLEEAAATGNLNTAQAVGDLEEAAAVGDIANVEAVGDLEEAAATGDIVEAVATGDVRTFKISGDVADAIAAELLYPNSGRPGAKDAPGSSAEKPGTERGWRCNAPPLSTGWVFLNTSELKDMVQEVIASSLNAETFLDKIDTKSLSDLIGYKVADDLAYRKETMYEDFIQWWLSYSSSGDDPFSKFAEAYLRFEEKVDQYQSDSNVLRANIAIILQKVTAMEKNWDYVSALIAEAV